MRPNEIKEFACYLRQLREQRGLTLREVGRRTGISNAYLSLLERGFRNPPRPDILRKLAESYGIPTIDLMRKAGYVVETDEYLSEDAKLEKAFQHVISDPEFEFGTRVTGPLSKDTKRFIIEMYEKAAGRKML